MLVDLELLRTLLHELIAIDSVNPSLAPGARGEAKVAAFLRDFLRRHGIGAELEEAAPGRPNVIGWLGPEGVPDSESKPAAADRRHASLAVLAHLDTVGAGNMREPFKPRESGGRIYGRGALDIKSGVAAMCAAAIALEHEGAALRKPLLIAGVVDEEYNSAGTEALLARYTADAAVVLEPTDLRVCIAHKGYAWFEVTTRGRAAHGSLPDEGRDAIRAMGRVLSLLDALDRKLAQQPPHALLGCGSLHASLIRGGQELSSYPAECMLQLERRTLPGERDSEVEAEIRGILEGLTARDPEFQATVRRLGSRPPYEISREAPIAQAAAEALRGVTGAAELGGMAAWTDTALLGAAGIPGVVFGPSGRGLHGAEEYVEWDSVMSCAETLRALMLRLSAT